MRVILLNGIKEKNRITGKKIEKERLGLRWTKGLC